MALTYCDVCGALLRGEAAATAEAGGGAICEACLSSRRAVVDDGDAAESAGPTTATAADVVQFNCCYCRSLLRLKPVAKRTKIKCPRCNDSFYLGPDGRVEARLEGSTTAVLTPLDPTQRPATPTEGMTPHMGQAPLSKTQPISRQEVRAQQDLLDGLKAKPQKTLEFLAKLPERKKDDDLIDTDAYASAGPLELVPTGSKPVARPTASQPKLRPSEEGKLDLDLEGLKRKTQKHARVTASGKGAQRPPEPEPERPAERPAKKKKAEAEPDRRPRGEAAGSSPEGEERAVPRSGTLDPEAEARREERERRAAESAARAAELEAEAARRGLGAMSQLLLGLAPALIALGLLSMTTRGSGFATRGTFGEKLRDLGGTVDRGVRSFGSTVNPVLPDGWKLPGIEQPRR